MELQLRSFVSIIFFLTLTSCLTIRTKEDLSKEYYNIANEFLKLENFSKAEELYKKSLDYNKDNFDTKLNLIIAYQGSRKYSDAELLIKDNYTERVSENNRKLLILLGRNHYLQSNFTSAFNIFKAYTELYPQDKLGYFNAGLCQLNLNNEESALEYFLKSYELDKNFVPSLYNITNYYYTKEMYNKAIPYITELVTKSPSDDTAHFMYSKILYSMKEWASARDSINQAIKLKDNSSEYYIFAAKIYAEGFNDKINTLLNIDKALTNGFKISELSKIEIFSSLRENYREEYNEVIKKYF